MTDTVPYQQAGTIWYCIQQFVYPSFIVCRTFASPSLTTFRVSLAPLSSLNRNESKKNMACWHINELASTSWQKTGETLADFGAFKQVLFWNETQLAKNKFNRAPEELAGENRRRHVKFFHRQAPAGSAFPVRQRRWYALPAGAGWA